jgi:hypothetical protein
MYLNELRGFTNVVVDKCLGPGGALSVRADYCMPVETDQFYYEVEILICGRKG